MDSARAIGSPASAVQAYMLATREAEAAACAAPYSRTESDLAAALDTGGSADPAKQQQATLHLISHIDAECFVSLLQILDPLPDDERDRAEYRRRYRQLQDALVIPLPPPDPAPLR
jgi:hypothetical protein